LSLEKLISGTIVILDSLQIHRSDFDFTDIPLATLRTMCDEKEFPPRFNLKVSSTSESQNPNRTSMCVTLTGVVERACNQEEPTRTIELLSSDLGPPERKSESLPL